MRIEQMLLFWKLSPELRKRLRLHICQQRGDRADRWCFVAASRGHDGSPIVLPNSSHSPEAKALQLRSQQIPLQLFSTILELNVAILKSLAADPAIRIAV